MFSIGDICLQDIPFESIYPKYAAASQSSDDEISSNVLASYADVLVALREHLPREPKGGLPRRLVVITGTLKYTPVLPRSPSTSPPCLNAFCTWTPHHLLTGNE